MPRTSAYSSQACSGSTVPDLYLDNQQGNSGEGPQAKKTPSNIAPENIALQQKPQGPFDGIPEDASLISMSMGAMTSDSLTSSRTAFLGSSEAVAARTPLP